MFNTLLSAVLITGIGMMSATSFDGKAFEARLRGELTSLSDVRALFPQETADPGRWASYIIEAAEQRVAAILAIPGQERTYANTVRALDALAGIYVTSMRDAHALGGSYGMVVASLHMFQMVSPNAEMRAACAAAVSELQSKAVDLFKSKAVYRAYKEYEAHAFTTESLTDEERRLFIDAMQSFKRGGYELSDEQFKQLRALEKDEAQLSLDFSQAIEADTSFILVEEADLVGVDPVFVAAQERVDGKVKLVCNYPTRAAVMEYCQTASVRRALRDAFSNRACPENVGRLEKLIEVRQKIADQLGFPSYAHLTLAAEMVETPERAKSFINGMISASQEKSATEIKRLLEDLPAGVELVDGKLAGYDSAYAHTHYIKKHFNLDSRAVAEYFPAETVLEGIFAIYQDFLNVQFRKEHFENPWHDSVRMLSVYAKDGSNCLGYVVLDLFPREQKYSHACQETITQALRWYDEEAQEWKQSKQVSLVVANFPQELPGKPALLTHDDVTTFFHEFGHAMHALLGRTTLCSTSGTSVKWDFVEMPSQIFEEWMWDRDLLKQVSKHYQTGAQIPDEMIDTLLHLRTFDSGSGVLGQAYFATLALVYFGPGAQKDSTQIMRDLGDQFFPMLAPNNTGHFHASFGHLSTYAARYYGYLWSKVFALDLFEKIKKEGLRNGVMGQEFIDKVLGKGGSADPNKLLQDFLGRMPTQDAFLRSTGLVS